MCINVYELQCMLEDACHVNQLFQFSIGSSSNGIEFLWKRRWSEHIERKLLIFEHDFLYIASRINFNTHTHTFSLSLSHTHSFMLSRSL